MQPLVGGGVWPRSLRIALVARTIGTAIYIVLLGLREDCPFKKWADSGSNFRPQLEDEATKRTHSLPRKLPSLAMDSLLPVCYPKILKPIPRKHKCERSLNIEGFV